MKTTKQQAAAKMIKAPLRFMLKKESNKPTVYEFESKEAIERGKLVRLISNDPEMLKTEPLIVTDCRRQAHAPQGKEVKYDITAQEFGFDIQQHVDNPQFDFKLKDGRAVTVKPMPVLDHGILQTEYYSKSMERALSGEWPIYDKVSALSETKTHEMREKVSQIDRAVADAAETMGEIIKRHEGLKRLSNDLYKPEYMETTKQQVDNGKAMTAIHEASADFRKTAIEWRNDYPEMTAIIKNLAHESGENEKRALLAEDSAQEWKRVAERRERLIGSLQNDLKKAFEQRDNANEKLHALAVRQNNDDDNLRKMNECALAMLELLKQDGFLKQKNFRRFKKALTNFAVMTYTQLKPICND